MILTRLLAAAVGTRAAARRRVRVRGLFTEAQSLLQAGDSSAAEQRLREALTLDPTAAVVHATLAMILTTEQRYETALEHFRAAEDGGAVQGDALHTYVRVLMETARYDEAERVAAAATRAGPRSYESWFCLGLACHALHRYADAMASYDKAHEIKSGADADLCTARGRTLQNMGRLDDALAEFDRALAMRPGDALARFHRSLVLLARGAYEAGWPEYEMRLLSAELQARPPQHRRWHPAHGARTVLVRSEQGLGDQIMFASCVPDLLSSGVRCVVECNPQLRGLFARSFAPAAVYSTAPDQKIPAAVSLQNIEAEVPIGSLPSYYRRKATDFPTHRGYLRAADDRVAVWRRRLMETGPGLRIGISWRGGTHASRAALRSIALDELLPVFATRAVSFVSVQYGSAARGEVEAFAERGGVAIRHFDEAIADYDETAALVSALDLTITVCTSIAHLCGALGRPVWVLVPKNPEWRYGAEGSHMDWYPSARLFRQVREADWRSPIEAVRTALDQLSAVRGEPACADTIQRHSTLRDAPGTPG